MIKVLLTGTTDLPDANTEDEDEFRPATVGELVIIALDTSVGDFCDALEIASEEGLREALRILQEPHPDDSTDPRIAYGIEQIEDALDKRGVEL